jgi:hypothetical protein
MALLLIPLACSNYNSVARQTVTTNYYLTEAMSAAQTMVSLTQTAMPSNTPEPTKTTRPPITMKLYEDFNDKQFDGSMSPIKWRIFFNPRCKAFQKDGSLIIIDTYEKNEFTSCLTKRAPDVWDSAAFSSIFLASSFFCSQQNPRPPTRRYRLLHLSRVTQRSFFYMCQIESPEPRG